METQPQRAPRTLRVPFIILAPVLALAGVDWFRRSFWGWLLDFLLIAINLAGDVFQLFVGEILQGLVGVLVAGLLLIYMVRSGVRGNFKWEV